MDNIEQNNSILPIQVDERENNGQLIPAAKERVKEIIEKHMHDNYSINISELAKTLCLERATVSRYVDECIEDWRKTDTRKLVIQKRFLMDSLSSLMKELETVSYKDLTKLKEFMDFFKDLLAMEKLQYGSADNADERNKMVNVHFNNLQMNPSMMKDLQKSMEKRHPDMQ